MDAPHVAEGDVSARIHDGDETLALDDPDPFEVGTPNDRMNALARTKPLLRKRHVNIPRHNSSLSKSLQVHRRELEHIPIQRPQYKFNLPKFKIILRDTAFKRLIQHSARNRTFDSSQILPHRVPGFFSFNNLLNPSPRELAEKSTRRTAFGIPSHNREKPNLEFFSKIRLLVKIVCENGVEIERLAVRALAALGSTPSRYVA